MHSPFKTAIVLTLTTGALAAEVLTSTFLKHCEEASRCENGIYLNLAVTTAISLADTTPTKPASLSSRFRLAY